MKKISIYILIGILVLFCSCTIYKNSKLYPAIRLQLPSLESPDSLRNDSIEGRVVMSLLVSAKKVKITKSAIVLFTLKNRYTGKNIFNFSQLENNIKGFDYNWKHYPIMVKKYEPFLMVYINNVGLFADNSPTSIKNDLWQSLTFQINFK
jgi:hypothetical protein